MKQVSLVAIFMMLSYLALAQETLQTVTDRGNTTTNSLQIGGGTVNTNLTKLLILNPAGKNFALSSGANYITEQGFHIYNWTDNKDSPLFSISNEGNVGIGTHLPQAKLHINAPLSGEAIKIGAANSPGNINVPLGASPGGYNIDFYTWRDIQGDQIGARIRAERINNCVNNNALIQSMDLAFYTSDGREQANLKEKMRINSNGNVGIGTTKPTEKLSVNGKIRAQEIKVENANWPDYVFTKSYALPSLQETEKQIQETGHLSGIPSATEVKANGIDLGEMNAKLLQKVEELTLYLIEKDKQDQAKSRKIEDLERRLNKLEK